MLSVRWLCHIQDRSWVVWIWGEMWLAWYTEMPSAKDKVLLACAQVELVRAVVSREWLSGVGRGLRRTGRGDKQKEISSWEVWLWRRARELTNFVNLHSHFSGGRLENGALDLSSFRFSEAERPASNVKNAPSGVSLIPLTTSLLWYSFAASLLLFMF